MKGSNGNYVLETTGNEFHANQSIIGLSEDGEIGLGYDNPLHVGELSEEPTDAEKAEIADHMIERWTRFRDGLRSSERRSERTGERQ